MTQTHRPLPGETAVELLRRVVRAEQAEAEAGLVAHARALDFTPAEIADFLAEVMSAHEQALHDAVAELRATGFADAAIVRPAVH